MEPARAEVPTVAPSAHRSLFDQDAYHALHLGPDERVLRFHHHTEAGRLVGSLGGVLIGTTWTSGHRAPFGGIDLVREWEAPAEIGALVEQTVDGLDAAGVRVARVRTKPTSWSEGEAACQQALLSRGFVVETAELSFSIAVDRFATDRIPDGGYEGSLKKEARKALHRARDLGLGRVALLERADWAEAFEVLRANRAGKGRPMNLELDYLLRAADAFGDRIRMLGQPADDGTLIAAALLYEPAPGRIVVVRWGDHFHAYPHSPMYLLAAEVVAHAAERGARTLDLGISSEAGVVNHGLAQFKRSVGANAELRLDLVRSR